MFVEGSENLPLVSREVFDDLQANVQDPEITRQYLLDYLHMWDGRFLKLSAAIDAGVGRRDAAIDAVLSIGTSSRMVGALRLAKVSSTIEQHLRAGDISGAACLLGELQAYGQSTMEELWRSVLHRSGAYSRHAMPLGQLARHPGGGAAAGSSGPITEWSACNRTPTGRA